MTHVEKDTKGPKNPRGDAVVVKILGATREELAKVGYRALRVEDVAVRADVHKTTIYRRWPTKKDLVQDAMSSLVDEHHVVPDTGTLRGDLIEILRNLTQFMTSVAGQGVMRMVMAESAEPEVLQICDSIRASREEADRAFLDRAIARGELRGDVDRELLLGLLFGSVHHRLFIMNQRVDDLYLGRIVDFVLLGASPREKSARRNRSLR